MVYIIKNDTDFLMHHGRKGQQWGVTNGPPYPLNTTSKTYGVKQALNNGLKNVKQFMYDRFSEYGKDHQAVRDKYVNQYMRKGYNETASQLLAEQKYQNMNNLLYGGAVGAIGGILAGTVGGYLVGDIIKRYRIVDFQDFIDKTKSILGNAASKGLSETMKTVNVGQILSDTAQTIDMKEVMSSVDMKELSKIAKQLN